MADVNDDGTLPYRSDGYVDQDTGMYTVPDPKVNDAAFTETEIGGKPAWLPVPRGVPIRTITFHTPFAYLQVSEALDHVRNCHELSLTPESPKWFRFIHPAFHTVIAVPREQMQRISWIIEDVLDLDKMKADIEMQQYAQTQQRAQLLAIHGNQKRRN